jgi:hypothetical protein
MRSWVVLLICLAAGYAYSQNNNIEQRNISGLFGLGNNHVLDEYVTKNEYTGISYSLGVHWTDRSTLRETGVRFEYGKISNLKNLNNKANVNNFNISYRYLYNVYSGSAFNKPLNVYLGPCFGIYMHYREQEVAVKKLPSIAVLLYANAAMSAVSSLTESFSIEGNLYLSVLSFTGRIPSIEDANNIPTPIALLSIPSLINVNASVFAQYNISGRVMLQVGYNFGFMQINKWDKFRLLSDDVIIKCGINF